MINTTYHKGGRLGNKLFRNIVCSVLAEKNNLNFSYDAYIETVSLGIPLFRGSQTFSDSFVLYDNEGEKILDTGLKANVILHDGFFHNPFCSKLVYDYFRQHEDSIKDANHYKKRYDKNNDVFVHVRLGDMEMFNAGFDYYDEVLSTICFFKGYISSDSIDHDICRQLIKKYQLEVYDNDEINTFMFASTCKHIVLTCGSFSYLIGALALPTSNVFYPESNHLSRWCGDIYRIESWNKVPNF
jgi:hypothetical protein